MYTTNVNVQLNMANANKNANQTNIKIDDKTDLHKLNETWQLIRHQAFSAQLVIVKRYQSEARRVVIELC